MAGAVGRALQQGEGCSWSSAVLDFSSYLAGGIGDPRRCPLCHFLVDGQQEASTKEETLCKSFKPRVPCVSVEICRYESCQH